ncbi:Testicular haploid expressed gene protein [Oryzias melastigma]|uniref:Testicular haploid expressed gene protein n=1 Tax=Oryzias melastigma TaxID=30732 RepID=A0A834BUW7_ORYME|nr:Testicular haploid expressed gene protein [Oryzias melastigma]
MTIRMQQLAQPKLNQLRYPDRLSLWEVSERALTAVASKRLCHLANPKSPVSAWQPDRPLPVPLQRETTPTLKVTALCSGPFPEEPENYRASQRMIELSQPKERKALFEGYNPYAVSRGALSASPSHRIQELSLPLLRKCISK